MPTEADYQAELERCNEYPDPIDAFGAILTVCDVLEIDPLRTIAKIRMKKPLDKYESVVDDLLAGSQSNWNRSLAMLHRALAADEMIARLGMEDR
jgi:hypothetical protein